MHGVSDDLMNDQLRKSMTLERQEEQVKTLLREFEHERQFTKTQIRHSNQASALDFRNSTSSLGQQNSHENEQEIINMSASEGEARQQVQP